MNDYCYRHEIINNYDSIFQFIDCTYVIIMNSSKYEKRVRTQLKRYPLSKKIILQWNSGYKNCKKDLALQSSVTDLTDSFTNVLQNALQNNYKNILVLEEDFIISPQIEDEDIVSDISIFFKKYQPDIILLGSVLWKTSKIIEDKFAKVDVKLGTHAIILNKVALQEIYNKLYFKKNNEIIDIDILTNNIKNKYAYKIPLITQVFSGTENRKNWGLHLGNNNKTSVNFYIWFIKSLGFTDEKTFQKAYEINYKVHFDKRYSIPKNMICYIAGEANKKYGS